MIVAPLIAVVLRPDHDAASRTERRREPLPAAPSLDWSAVAECESGGDWSIDSGNGYYGGLQFTEATWDGFGGQDYATRPDLASEAEQIVVAERVLRVQGPGAWPVCSRSAA